MYKQLIILLVIAMSSLSSMQKSKTIKRDKPQATGDMKCLTKDIACRQIQSWLTFREIFRLRRLSRYYNELYDIESNCCSWGSNDCKTYACNHCAKSYYQCTKMLVYFALNGNEQMFKHIWFYHSDIRKNNVTRLVKRDKKKYEFMIKGEKTPHSKEVTMQEAMHCYRKYYSHLESIHKHIFRRAIKAIHSEDIDLANTVLSESGLSLFDFLKNPVDIEYLEDIVGKACLLHNVDIIKNICGGCVDENSLMYIVRHASAQLQCDLMDSNILSVECTTKGSKKTVLHYAAEKGFHNVIKRALEMGAYPNCRDVLGKTPLHYAAQEEKLAVVRELLKSEDADVRLKDKKGRTAIDYNVPQRDHWLKSPQETYARKEIAKMLMNHKDQHQVSGYSRSKVHCNGYQELL